MSASMAEVVARHQMLAGGGWFACSDPDKKPFVDKCDGCGEVILTWGTNGDLPELIAAHQAEQLAANGYGKLGPTQFVLREREAELLKLKGPCSSKTCPLHYAHSGPCDRRPE